MASIQQLINEVTAIKGASENLANVAGAASGQLNNQSMGITRLVRGSQTGQEAVMAMGVAARSLVEAAASMKSLGRACDDCIKDLSK